MRISDWSSDVCSSDLLVARDFEHRLVLVRVERQADRRDARDAIAFEDAKQFTLGGFQPGDQRLDAFVGALFVAERGERAAEVVGYRRSEERRVGKGGGSSGRSRWWPDQ